MRKRCEGGKMRKGNEQPAAIVITSSPEKLKEQLKEAARKTELYKKEVMGRPLGEIVFDGEKGVYSQKVDGGVTIISLAPPLPFVKETFELIKDSILTLEKKGVLEVLSLFDPIFM
jgi:hypothetical protein